MRSNFQSNYKLCVKLPGEPRECKAFDLVRRPGGTYGSKIDFVRAFSSHSDGRYSVTWYWGDSQLAPPLYFSKD